jgi:nucleoid-associated protein YgaU
MPRQAGLSVLLSFTLIALVAASLVGPGVPLGERGSRRSSPESRAEPIVAAGGRMESASSTSLAAANPPREAAVPRTARLPQPSAGQPWPHAEAICPATQDRRDWVSRCGPFTAVRDGESLEQVAQRVYGDRAAVGHLLAANRDQIENPDAPLQAGQPLRTP